MEMIKCLSLGFLVVMGFVCSSHGKDFYVGGKEGWTVKPSVNYNNWAKKNRFSVDDNIIFKYKKGEDSVLVVSKEGYEKCDTKSPIKRFDDGDSKFQFDRSGPFYFISGQPGNCEKGQKLIVVVLAVKGGVPPPKSPSPVAPPPGSPAPKASSPQAQAPVAPGPKAQAPIAPSPKAQSPSLAPSPNAQPPKAQGPIAPSPQAQAPIAPSPQAQAPNAPSPQAQAPNSPSPKASSPSETPPGQAPSTAPTTSGGTGTADTPTPSANPAANEGAPARNSATTVSSSSVALVSATTLVLSLLFGSF